MNVVVFGATGMVGSGVVIECLEDARVASVLLVGRRPSGVHHAKVRELVREDLFDWSDAADELRGLDACFFCLGVSAAGMSEESYGRVTYDLTMATAEALLAASPSVTFCYVSGQGTDSTERGRFMWARVKGRTENHLLGAVPDAYMFRPGYIQPLKGVRSKTKLYQALYTVAAPTFPILRRLAPRYVTTTVNVGRAMIRVAHEGYAKRILETPDINALAEESPVG